MTAQRPVRPQPERDHDAVEAVPVRARVRMPGWPHIEIEIEAESHEALSHHDPSAWRRES